MIHWVETPSTPPFICQGGRVYKEDQVGCSFIQSGLYLYLSILQDLSTKYILNCHGNRPRGPNLQVEWADPWCPPPFLLSESRPSGTHDIKPHQQPSTAWQVNLGLENSNLPCSSEIVECSVLSRIIGRVPCNAGGVLLSQFGMDRSTY
jgi:hypothetical protein